MKIKFLILSFLVIKFCSTHLYAYSCNECSTSDSIESIEIYWDFNSIKIIKEGLICVREGKYEDDFIFFIPITDVNTIAREKYYELLFNKKIFESLPNTIPELKPNEKIFGDVMYIRIIYPNSLRIITVYSLKNDLLIELLMSINNMLPQGKAELYKYPF